MHRMRANSASSRRPVGHWPFGGAFHARRFEGVSLAKRARLHATATTFLRRFLLSILYIHPVGCKSDL